MLRVTKTTDYGLVLLAQIAGAGAGTEVAARDLADAAGVPHEMVRKILKALVREGLLASSRGAQGGYRLAKAPGEVSVADVITALEGPIFLTDCLAEAQCTCQLEAQCPCAGAWQHVNRVLVTTLQGITLADLSKGTFGTRQSPRVAVTA